MPRPSLSQVIERIGHHARAAIPARFVGSITVEIRLLPASMEWPLNDRVVMEIRRKGHPSDITVIITSTEIEDNRFGVIDDRIKAGFEAYAARPA